MEGNNALQISGESREMGAWSPENVMEQVKAIQHLMREAMKNNEHYGIVPGCVKPSLLKPGAEKLCLMFRLGARYKIEKMDLGNGHREITITCALHHINTGAFWGEGVGSCSTMETKYRYRGNEAVSTGVPVPKGYWDLKKTDFKAAQELLGGSGYMAKKLDEGWMICEKGQKQENPDIADTYNTVLKMAKKRALVDATLNATAASDIFTQDVAEDAPEVKPAPVEVKSAGTPQPVKARFITEAQGKELVTVAKSKGLTTGALARQANVQRLSEITVDQLPGLMKWIELQTLPKEIDKEFDAVFESLIRAGVANADLSDYIESLGMDRASLTDHLKKIIDNYKKENLPQVFLNKAEAVRADNKK